MKTQKKIEDLRSSLNARFPERTHIIDGALGALLAGEHVLLLGPPGTAKSALVRAMAGSIGGSYFEHLVTKFTTPEELFGPLSLAALEKDRFLRVTNGKLPEAEVAFIDEVFKASSAILNTTLTLLNERVFHNDGRPMSCPLISCFGASNELPDGKELEALMDRFILRFEVGYLLRPSNLRAVLVNGTVASPVQLTLAELRAAQADVAKVKVSDETIEALINIRDACKAEGIIASDRRWKQSLKLVQATAWMSGETVTAPEDLAVLVDVLWREPRERPKVARLVGRLSDPVGSQATEILDAAREVASKATALKDSDRKQYVASCAEALTQFTQQQVKLRSLASSAGKRSKRVIQDAAAEIASMHDELARVLSNGLGLGFRSAR